MIRSPCSTPIVTRRINLNDRSRIVEQRSTDSFGNESPKYDIPLFRNSGSSDYAVINTKQLYTEKRSLISKRSPSVITTRLPHLRKNVNHTNLPPSLNDCDSRNVYQSRHNSETVDALHEKNAALTTSKSAGRSRLPKISSILTEKKKCSSWLSRIKTTK
uniref:DUF4005 domain-containing protein n=1 Tax=Setaria digitata TaxID=48799 RepID=A0A915Q0W0_9BILA